MLIKIVFFDKNTQDFYDTLIIFQLLACLTPGFQGHEQRRRLIEMECLAHSRTWLQCWRGN